MFTNKEVFKVIIELDKQQECTANRDSIIHELLREYPSRNRMTAYKVKVKVMNSIRWLESQGLCGSRLLGVGDNIPVYYRVFTKGREVAKQQGWL